MEVYRPEVQCCLDIDSDSAARWILYGAYDMCKTLMMVIPKRKTQTSSVIQDFVFFGPKIGSSSKHNGLCFEVVYSPISTLDGSVRQVHDVAREM